jgi:hypothetical protein
VVEHAQHPLWVGGELASEAAAIYWLSLSLLGALLFSSLGYASRARLLVAETPADYLHAARRRILVY